MCEEMSTSSDHDSLAGQITDILGWVKRGHAEESDIASDFGRGWWLLLLTRYKQQLYLDDG